ncbi:MAG: hypothetical protein IKB51_05985 [Clostridia bacterium]|nr:hypothetical protein [Clostridia bacterium]
MNQLQNYSNNASAFEAMRMNNSEYTVSLLREAVRVGVIDESKEAALKAKVFDGLAIVIDEFSEGKSTSVSNDKANELLSSLLYNVDAYLISLKNPEKALIELEEKTVKYLYDAGGVALKRVMADCTALLFNNKKNRLPEGSDIYNRALDEDIRAFSKSYNIRFGAHRNPVIPRYKTALTPRGSGVVRLKKYLANLLTENLFCRCYESDEVKTVIAFEVLRAEDMESSVGNLYVPILRCALICQFLMPGIAHVLLSEDDVKNAEALLDEYTPDEMRKVLTAAFNRLPSQNREYHHKVFENELPQIINAVKHNNLRTMLAYLPKVK